MPEPFAPADAGLRPDDPHDRALLAAVRPAAWPAPPAAADPYDLVVVGAGTAGLVSAAIAVGLGARTALVERRLMGGDCLILGCVPSKALLRAAHAAHAHGTAPDDPAAAFTRMRTLRARLAAADSAERFQGLGADVLFGHARFTGSDALAVTDDAGTARTLRFRRAIVTAGGRPALPDVPGLAECRPHTNETIFGLERPPAHLLVLGGGPIACELAQAFVRLGSRVTLAANSARLLPRDDADAAATVARALAADGVTLHLQARATAARRDGDGPTTLTVETPAGTHQLTGDALLVAAGRRPNVETLALDAAGVEVTGDGIVVDDRFRTASARIFAIGDCIAGGPRFTHAADAMARLAVPNALFGGLGGGKRDALVLPWCTYTSPEVAHVGRTADQLARDGTAHDTITVPLAENDRAVLDGAEDGFFRVHVERGGDRILGATLVGPRAGEMLGEVTLAMTHDLGLGALGRTVHPYPTIGDAFRRAADQRRRERLTPAARRALHAALAVFRRLA